MTHMFLFRGGALHVRFVGAFPRPLHHNRTSRHALVSGPSTSNLATRERELSAVRSRTIGWAFQGAKAPAMTHQRHAVARRCRASAVVVFRCGACRPSNNTDESARILACGASLRQTRLVLARPNLEGSL